MQQQQATPQPAKGQSIEMKASGGGVGAELRGLDVKGLDKDGFRLVHRAWIDHQVLLFRGQHLSDGELITFSRRFGCLDVAPNQETGQRFVEGYPELYVVSNVVENGRPIGSLGSGEAVWHTDMSYLPDPPKASVLYAIEVPPSGGDTGFVNMYAAYEALPEALKARLTGLRVKHDGTYNSGGYVRHGVAATDDPVAAPGTLHPLVCTHPESGRRVLYLGRRRNAYIEGLPLAESEALLDEVWTYATRDEFTWHHHWTVGDLVMWDNRCTMHRRDPFDATGRRVLHRTQIKAETRPSA
ncbi:MAG: TauD/TfdA family dioxygenase [Steroidobacteraceae bacterium]|jgi:taurine dioxygenase